MADKLKIILENIIKSSENNLTELKKAQYTLSLLMKKPVNNESQIREQESVYPNKEYIYLLNCGDLEGNFKHSMIDRINSGIEPLWGINSKKTINVVQTLINRSKTSNIYIIFKAKGSKFCGIGKIDRIEKITNIQENNKANGWFNGDWNKNIYFSSYYSIIDKTELSYNTLLRVNKKRFSMSSVNEVSKELYTYLIPQIKDLILNNKPLYIQRNTC